ncbi:MAG: flagellar hook-length control protein FliK [Parvularculaceae bacterium]
MDFLAALLPSRDNPQNREIDAPALDESGDSVDSQRAFTATFQENAPLQAAMLEVNLGDDIAEQIRTKSFDAAATLALDKFNRIRSDPDSAFALSATAISTEEAGAVNAALDLSGGDDDAAAASKLSTDFTATGRKTPAIEEALIQTASAPAALPQDVQPLAPLTANTLTATPAPAPDDIDNAIRAEEPASRSARAVAEINARPASSGGALTRSLTGAPDISPDAAPAREAPETPLRRDAGDARIFAGDVDINPRQQSRAQPNASITGATIAAPTEEAAKVFRSSDTPTFLAAAIDRVAAGADVEHHLASTRANPVHTPAQQAASLADPARQVVAAIRSAPGQGGDSIDVRLDPPDLGRVRIHFSMHTPHAVTATISSEQGDTLDILRRHGDDLVKELRHAGFESVNLEFSSHRERAPEFDETPEQPLAEAARIDASTDRNIVYLSMRDGNHLDRLV